jgi:hypothetical protein
MRTANSLKRVYMGQFNSKWLKIFTEGQFIVECVLYVVECSGKAMWVFVMDTWTLSIYISQSAGVCTCYVVTEHERNMNMGNITVNNTFNIIHSLKLYVQDM